MKKAAAIFHHVLIDTGDGGNRGVIARDGESVLIPTPEWHEGRLYPKEYLRQRGMYKLEDGFPAYDEVKVQFRGAPHTLAEFLAGKRIKRCIVHGDPEFQTWTYGFGATNPLNRRIAKNFDPGDHIFLASSLRLEGDSWRWAKFLIGVLVFDEIYYQGFAGTLENLLRRRSHAHHFQISDHVPRIERNFHYRAEYTDPDLFIITGNPSRSFLLPKPIRITVWNARDGTLIHPLKDWDGMPKFHMDSPGIKARRSVENLLKLLRDPIESKHPDFKRGQYFLQVP